MRWQNICYRKLKRRFQTLGTLALLLETISCIYFMTSDRRFAEPIKQLPLGGWSWLVLWKIESQTWDRGARRGLSPGFGPHHPQVCCLVRPPHPPNSLSFAGSLMMAEGAASSLWDQEEPETKLTRAPSTRSGRAPAHPGNSINRIAKCTAPGHGATKSGNREAM